MQYLKKALTDKLFGRANDIYNDVICNWKDGSKLIFNGPESVGKTTTALHAAYYITYGQHIQSNNLVSSIDPNIHIINNDTDNAQDIEERLAHSNKGNFYIISCDICKSSSLLMSSNSIIFINTNIKSDIGIRFTYLDYDAFMNILNIYLADNNIDADDNMRNLAFHYSNGRVKHALDFIDNYHIYNGIIEAIRNRDINFKPTDYTLGLYFLIFIINSIVLNRFDIDRGVKDEIQKIDFYSLILSIENVTDIINKYNVNRHDDIFCYLFLHALGL